jgi:ABC-type antimicrobial peptide transport system permease subunit
VLLLLLAAAVVSLAAPAWHASRLDPVEALRRD